MAQPADDNLAQPADDDPAQSSDDNPAQPADDNPAQSADDNPAQSADDNPAQPADDNPAQSADDNPAQPADDNPAQPADDNPAQPADDNPAQSADDNPADQKPAQPLSIQWINLERVKIRGQLHKKCDLFEVSSSDLLEAIQGIIGKYNEERKDKDSDLDYKPEEPFRVKGYSFQTYSYRKEVTPTIAKQSQKRPETTKNLSFVVFLYRHQPRVRIIALTSRNAWQVVRPYVDYSFPVEVAERVCNPKKIFQITRRCLFKENAKENLLYPYEYELYKTSNLYYLVDSFKCDIKAKSQLHSIINRIRTHNKERKLNRFWINVTMGGLLRVGVRLRLRDYPAIIKLFAKYMRGERTLDVDDREEEKDPLFEFLHCFHPAPLEKGELDKQLIKSIFSQREQIEEIRVHVRHKYLEDFLLSSSFAIKVDSDDFEDFGSKPPTIGEIIGKIQYENEQEFIQAIQTSELRFTDQESNELEETIIDCLEGELRDRDGLYFKVKKMWYVLEWDYLALLHEDFMKLIKNVLIKGGEEKLPRAWKGNDGGEREEVYNRSYIGDKNYLVFDQICVDNIELCDILKYTEDAVYLYHVKENFGQHTRDACSQILNAAIVFRSALVTRQSPNYLQKLWKQAMTSSTKEWREKIRTELKKLGEEPFINIFHNRKIVFVYAYLPSKNQSLSESIKASDPIEKSLNEKLINSGYLDSYGRLTSKFFSTNKEDFKLEGESTKPSKEIYDQLAKCKFSRSNLAKIELVQLAQNLRKMNFEFKICEIPRKY